MKSKATWAEKRDAPKEAQRVILKKGFADVPAGAELLIPTPKLVDEAIRELPAGQLTEVKAFRRKLAQAHGVDEACPLTTGIFVRIAAEAAFEEEQAGRADITPVWRIINPKSPLAKKITAGPEWLARHRTAEGF